MSSRRNSASSLLTAQRSQHSFHSNTPDHSQDTSDDGYDYNSVKVDPATEPTRKAHNEVATNVQRNVQNPSAIRITSDADASFEETSPNIWQRGFAGRRAQLPDEEKAITNRPAQDHEHPSQSHIDTDLSTLSRDSAKARHIALSWNLSRKDKRLVLELSVSAPQTKSEDEILPKRVLWLHDEQRLLGIQKLEEIILKCKPRGLSKSEIGLTRRLLERVRNTAEKSFVGGKFLVPTALRYDNQDMSRYTVDQTCIFFCFPYFSVAEPSYGEYAGKDSSEHPPRTLLQSRYRLNKTTDRDKKQCIRLLTNKAVSSSDVARKARRISLPFQETGQLVYVPQLWGVLIGLDCLVTCGPISETALQSDSVITPPQSSIATREKLALVRIQFAYREREDLIYPIEQCNSWFGLLNKQQQILDFSNDQQGAPNPKNHPFWLNGTQITINNWTTIINESQSTEMLSIWMKSESLEVPKIRIYDAGDASENFPQNSPDLNISEASTVKEPNMNELVSPILAWPILDSFGEVDGQSGATQVERFLTRIYLFLFEEGGIQKQHRAARPTLANAKDLANKQRIPKVAKTFAEVNQSINTDISSKSATALFKILDRLFRIFIPANQDQALFPIQLYWGAVHEICEAAHKNAFGSVSIQLLETLETIAHHGSRLHQGVFCRVYSEDSTTKEWTSVESLAEGTTLLAGMVDALGAIFHLLVEILHFLRKDGKAKTADLMGPGSKVIEYSVKAVKHLTDSRDQLIRELHGRDKSNTIGPVITPEAITIKLLERLAYGVSQTCEIDIIHLYEECLEHLSLKVESEASRRLLMDINVFQEEVAVVRRVLKEQYDVLLSLRKSLDPKSFQSPSIVRKLRYKFECTAIDKILTTIDEHIKNSNELQQRAKELAVQNVQLVETLQDDQSRAIFVFTIVTIIFLPLSFIAGFFGMNFDSITNSSYGVLHFWEIAVPVTVAIFVLCTIVAFKGESLFLWVSRCNHWLKKKRTNAKDKTG